MIRRAWWPGRLAHSWAVRFRACVYACAALVCCGAGRRLEQGVLLTSGMMLRTRHAQTGAGWLGKGSGMSKAAEDEELTRLGMTRESAKMMQQVPCKPANHKFDQHASSMGADRAMVVCQTAGVGLSGSERGAERHFQFLQRLRCAILRLGPSWASKETRISRRPAVRRRASKQKAIYVY